jgi:hypothetical protein
MLYLLLALFVYYQILVPYYQYWFLKRQGLPTTGFPLPILGTMIKFAKSLKGRNEYFRNPGMHYYEYIFG